MTVPPHWRRRALLGAAAAGLAAVWNAGPLLRRLLPQDFDFAPLDDPPGFRRVAGGATSGGLDLFAGIGGGTAPEAADPAALRADLCRALFGGPVPEGVVPVAAFSDYYCPYCRVMTGVLSEIAATPGSAVRVSWHEWPLLGSTSEVAARAALAAERQGAYAAFQAALMRGGFVPTPAFLESLAARIGIDAARMRADMDSPATTRAIAESRGLARLFGFPGTPALVVGRTVVVGAIDDARLRALIALEREDGPPPGCATA